MSNTNQSALSFIETRLRTIAMYTEEGLQECRAKLPEEQNLRSELQDCQRRLKAGEDTWEAGYKEKLALEEELRVAKAELASVRDALGAKYNAEDERRMDRFHCEIRDLKEQLQLKIDQLRLTEHQFDNLAQRYREKEEQVVKLSRDNAEDKHKIDRLYSEIQNLKLQLELKQRRNEGLETLYAGAAARADGHRTEIEKLNGDVARGAAAWEHMKQMYFTLEQAHFKSEKTIKELSAELDKQKAQVKASLQQMGDAWAAAVQASKDRTVVTMREEVERLEKRVAELINGKKDLADALARTAEKLISSDKQREELEGQLKEEISRTPIGPEVSYEVYAALERRAIAMEKQLKQTRLQLSEAQAKVNNQQKLQHELGVFIDSVKTQAAALEKLQNDQHV